MRETSWSTGWSTWVRRTVVVAVVAVVAGALEAPDLRAQTAPTAPTVVADPVVRVAGDDRVSTAVAVSRRSWPTGSAEVVLATSQRYPDALAAGPLARSLGAPILLTAPDALPAEVRDELARLAATRVTIIGGTAAIAPAVEQEVAALGVAVRRIAGAERSATAAAVARELGAPDGVVALAAGRSPSGDDGWADALIAGSLGVPGRIIPTLLTDPGALPDVTRDALRSFGATTVVIVGGTAAVAPVVADAVEALGLTVRREAGASRYDTAVALARTVLAQRSGAHSLVFTTAAAYPDSLVAGAITARLPAPILLVPARLSAAAAALPAGERLASMQPRLAALLRDLCGLELPALLLGGAGAVSAEIADELALLLTCTDGSTTVGGGASSGGGSTGGSSGGGGGGGGATTSTTTTTTTASTSSSTTSTTTTTTLPPGVLVAPDVVGMSQGAAITEITDATLSPGQFTFERSSTARAGRVLSQRPAGGTAVGEGDPVDLTISLGPELKTIPDVVGMHEDDAASTVAAAGFVVGVVGDVTSDDIDPGDVAKQLPLAGTVAVPGSLVDIDVARGDVNDAPVITTEPELDLVAGETFEYDADADDADDDTLSWSLMGAPPGASIDEQTGEVTWPSDTDDAGPFDLTVRVDDGRDAFDVQSFTLLVDGGPTARDDSYQYRMGEGLTEAGANLLDNDSDPNGDPLTASVVDGPGTGNVEVNADGTFTYTPAVPGTDHVHEGVDLTMLAGAVATATSEQASYPASRLIDGYDRTSWFAPVGTDPAATTVTVTFGADVTVTDVNITGNRQLADAGSGVATATIRLKDSGGTEVFSAPVTFEPAVAGDGADRDVDIDVVAANGSAVVGVRSIELVIGTLDPPASHPGLGEIRVRGDGPALTLAPQLEWSLPAGAPGAMVTPTVGDLDRDGVPEVVFNAVDSTLRVVSGVDGSAKWTVPSMHNQSGSPVLADLVDEPGDDSDDGIEIAAVRSDGRTVAVFGHDGSLLASINTTLNVFEGNLAVADLDADSKPDIIVPGSGRIAAYEMSGGILTEVLRTEAHGCANTTYRDNCIPLVGDVDLDGEIEIVAGRTIYGSDGATERRNLAISDGWNALADFDSDPFPEIVHVNGGQVRVLEHDLRVKWGPISIPEGGTGGPPTVADVDADGSPDIGVAGYQRYAVFELNAAGTGLQLRWASPIFDLSNRTGSTVFDFDDDGATEIVFRDEDHLFVYDGSTGAVRFQTPMGSSTTVDSPVVADVDGDGEAEIIATADLSRALPDGTVRPRGVYVFGSPADNWVRARAIWNQHSYHVTNVLADGSIPLVERHSWLLPGLNSYRQNLFLPDEAEQADSFTYTVTDGVNTSSPATVRIDVVPAENAPSITCEAPTTATVGFSYAHAVCAQDPDPGDELSFSMTARRFADVDVAGWRNPWLAGMPDGTVDGTDAAPDQGPALFSGIDVTPGASLRFATSGWTHSTTGTTGPGPDGGTVVTSAARHGKSGIKAPVSSLVGVFLGPAVPATAPADLDFTSVLSRSYVSLSPALGQVFFIGDGVDGAGAPQGVVVPAGATRLFLGNMDNTAHADDAGIFEVRVSTTDTDGPTIDPATGLVTWTPSTVGSHELWFRVEDQTGRSASQVARVTVGEPLLVPDVVGLTEVEAAALLGLAGFELGLVQREHDPDLPLDDVMEQAPGSGAVAAPGAPVDVVVSDGPVPVEEEPDPELPPPPDEPEVTGLLMNPVDPWRRVGDRVQMVAHGTVNGCTCHDVTQLADWSSSAPDIASVNETGRVTGITAGTAVITASYDGFEASRTVTIVDGPAPPDQTLPLASISSPAAGALVSEAVDVEGTATDANLDEWTLTLLDQGGATVDALGDGTDPVTSDVLATLDPTGFADGEYALLLEVRDVAGNTVRVSYPVTFGPEPPPPPPPCDPDVDPDCDPDPDPPDPVLDGILLNPVNPSVVAGSTLLLSGTAYYDDGSSVPLNGASAATWSSDDTDVVTIDDAGRITGVAAGTATVSVTFQGQTASRTALVVAPEPTTVDRTPPVARFTTPAFATTVDQPLEVVGTATDASLLRWTLELVDGGGALVAPIADGTGTVSDGALGTLDPTLLINGSYQLLLTAYDTSGNEATATVPVEIDGQMKLGAFALSFTDLVVPMPGLRIAVDRSYDTRDDGRGDFGVGWRLGLRNLRLQVSGMPGEDWALAGGGFRWQLQPTAAHPVSLTLPDGTTEKFDLRVSPSATAFVPPTFVTASFAPRPGTRGQLTPLGNRDLIVLSGGGGDVELVDDTTFLTYAPTSYRYTAPDGTAYTISTRDGVQGVRDPNGNSLTITTDGITHSSGRSVDFERDALGRITAVTDPEGNIQRYQYDGRGDLVAHTDAEGNTTTYRYDSRHDLLEIIDPLGRSIARQEYDDAGRMVAFVTGEGRRVELSQDLDARTEQITDDDGDVTTIEYDEQGNVLRTIDPDGGITESTYDADGNRLTLTDAVGRTTTWTYDGRGNPLTETNHAGETSTRTFDAADRVTSVTDARLHTTTYRYDARGNEIEVRNAAGVVEVTRTFDAAGNLRTVTDALGAMQQHEYDAQGNRVATVDAVGARTTIDHDLNGMPIERVDANGGVSTLTVDRRGMPTSVTGPTGMTTDVELDHAGRVVRVETGAGVVEVDLDAEGKERSSSDPLEGLRTFTYGPDGERTSMTDARGETRWTYDDLGRPTSETGPDGAVVATTYDLAGQVLTETGPNGGVTTFTYDDAGRTETVTDPEGGLTTFGYDAAGNLVTVLDAVGGTTTHTYDDLDRRTATAHPDGTTESWVYDDAGRVIEHVDQLGAVTSFTYDAAGQLVEVIDDEGGRTLAAYDAKGNRTSITDAAGHTTRYRHDGIGNVVEVIHPDGTSESHTYDESGNMVVTVDRNGDTITRTFDGGGRVLTESYDDGTTITNAYDGLGQLVRTTDQRGDTLYTRDEMGRVLVVEHPGGESISYEYDLAGNRTEMEVRTAEGAEPSVTAYTYDLADRMTSVTDPTGGVTTYTYDDGGRPVAVLLANGVTTDLDYDPMGRATEIEHRLGGAVLDRFTYVRDDRGDPTSVTSLDGSSSTFAYDDLRRLVQEAHAAPGGAVLAGWTYTYDAVGNRTSSTAVGGAVTTYTYGASHQLMEAGDASFSYDAEGNQILSDDGTEQTIYGYDGRGLLTSAITPDGVTTYEHDGAGNRVARGGEGGDVSFLVDAESPTGFADVVAEHDDGTVSRSYTHGRDLVSERNGATGPTSYLHGDALGSVRLVTDDSGAVTGTRSYAAFGEQLSSTGVAMSAYGFAGERLDDETGLYHLRARQYRPETGTLTSVDPYAGVLDDPVTRHPYTYARSNPLTFTDPSGREAFMGTVIAAGLVAGLVAWYTAPTGVDPIGRAIIAGVLAVGFAPIVIVAGGMLSMAAGLVTGGVGGAVSLAVFALAFFIVVKVGTDVLGACLVGISDDVPCDPVAQAIASLAGIVTGFGVGKVIGRFGKAVFKPALEFAKKVLDVFLAYVQDMLGGKLSEDPKK